MTGSRGEVLLLDFRRGGASTVLVDGVLSLGSVLLGKTLDGLGGVSGVLIRETLDLSGLLASDLTALLKLSVDDLLVLNVDERSEVGDKGGDQGQAPERNNLDEEVRDQGSEEGLCEYVSEIPNEKAANAFKPASQLTGLLTAPVAYTFSAKTMR
jgi:hypothetical protein